MSMVYIKEYEADDSQLPYDAITNIDLFPQIVPCQYNNQSEGRITVCPEQPVSAETMYICIP